MSKSRSKRKPSPDAESGFVSVSRPQSLALTVYKGGAALFREQRSVSLPAGTSKLQLEGLPSEEVFIDDSLVLVSVDGKGNFKAGPVSFRPGNLNVPNILAGAIGKRITVYDRHPDRTEPIPGVLRHILGSQIVLEVSGTRVLVLPHPSRFDLPSGLPEGLSAESSLVMEPTVEKAGAFVLHLLYEADGIAWKPRYTAFYDSDAGKLSRLDCWVDITNNTGTKLDGASFKLLDGYNRSRRRHAYAGGMEAMTLQAAAVPTRGVAMKAAITADESEAENVGEQHLYVLPGSFSLANGERKQACLLMKTDVPVEQEYHLHSHYGYQPFNATVDPEDLPRLPVNVRLRLVNDEASRLGTALPAGQITFLEPDSSGSQQKTDTASIGHVSVDEKFNIDLSTPARDLKATRRLVDFHQDPPPPVEEDEEEIDEPVRFPVRPLEAAGGPDVGTPAEHSRRLQEAAESAGKRKKRKPKKVPRFRTEAREVVLYNYRDKDVTVCVEEDIPTGSQWLGQSHEVSEQALGCCRFCIPVPAKGKATLSYRIKWQIN